METPQLRNVRSPSISSDVVSNSSRSVTTAASVPYANPPPAYVSPVEASKLITAELERPVTVSPSALTLVNEFLDQVLYSIISTSHSVSLGHLTAAVPVVLKPRLGKAALRVAEEELKEYLDDGEEAELTSRKGLQQTELEFDADLVWKIARLRCMVYARLGDLEEEDEEEWLEKEQLLDQAAAAQKKSKQSLEIGPGAAIFLTSVIEYLGEQALYYAAQHAQKRHDSIKTPITPSTDGGSPLSRSTTDEIVLDGKDMNHVGRDSPLSRLWRSWRRNTRTQNESTSRSLSPEMVQSALSDSPGAGRRINAGHHHSIPSIAEENIVPIDHGGQRSPALLPLPESDGELDDNASDDDHTFVLHKDGQRKRPISMVMMPGRFPSYESTIVEDQPELPERSPLRPSITRNRSQSMPSTVVPFDTSKTVDVLSKDIPAETDDAEKATSNINGDEVDHVTDDSADKPKATSGLVAATAATMASALGIVGIHHVVGSDSEKEPADVQTNYEERLTRASITGPADFDNMHLPYGRDTPESLNVSRSPQPRADHGKMLNASNGSIDTQPSPEPQELSGQSSFIPHTAAGTQLGREADISPMSDEEDRDPFITSSNRASTEKHPQVGHGAAHAHHASTVSHVSQHSKSSSSSSRLLGFTRDDKGRPQTIHQQRAAGEMPDDLRAAYSPTPTHSTKGGRSDTPHSLEQRRPHARIRSDSEELLSNTTTDQEEAKRSLDVLINGDETLHYKLTPAAAEVEEDLVPASPRKTDTQDLADFLRNTGPPGSSVPRHVSSSSSRSSSDYGSAGPTVMPSRRSAERRVIPSSRNFTPLSSNPVKSRNQIGEPRDARVESAAGTRDLADYARSTGPSDDTQLPKPIGGRVMSPKPPSTAQSSISKPQNRLKFQARDPRPSRNAESAELIDFIREGPPRAPGEHRIDRHVAPFRTTMDSDDFNALAGGTDRLRVSDSTMGTSANSQTPLVGRSQAVNGGAATPDTVIARPTTRDADDFTPKRTQKRVKDPYALDDSDDEAEAGAAVAKSNEESLIDFLRNTAPPPNMHVQPALSVPDDAAPFPVVHRSPSGARLREMVRNARSPTPAAGNRTNSLKKAGPPRAESPHLTQFGTKRDTYRPTQVTHAAHVDKHRSKSRQEPSTSTRAGVGDTADLAEYLRNTGPPPGYQPEPQPFLLSQDTLNQHHVTNGEAKEDQGLKKFFTLKGRNKN